jgi:hypothetical protein
MIGEEVLLISWYSICPKSKISQKLKPTNFDQIFKKISTSRVLNGHIAKIYFMINLVIMNKYCNIYIFIHKFNQTYTTFEY